jgi:Dynein heavy chain, N-terminal region 2
MKCFEGIKSLKFDEQKKIYGMYSAEKEYVEYNPIIDTSLARG